MTDYSTFNSVSSNGTSYGPISENTTSTTTNNNNANIFDIAHSDLQAFTNTSQHHHHHFSQFYNQTQNVYNQINTDAFSQHHHHQHQNHQIPALGNYKNSASYGGMSTSHTWKNFSVHNSASSASSSPHIETNTNNTDNNQCLQVQSSNFQSGKT